MKLISHVTTIIFVKYQQVIIYLILSILERKWPWIHESRPLTPKCTKLWPSRISTQIHANTWGSKSWPQLADIKLHVKVTQSCLTLWPHGLYGPWNSPGQNTGVGSRSPGESPQPRAQTQVSYTVGGFFTSWATREARGVSFRQFFKISATLNRFS